MMPYLLVENEFLLFEDLEVFLEPVELGLLLQTALHSALAVLD